MVIYDILVDEPKSVDKVIFYLIFTLGYSILKVYALLSSKYLDIATQPFALFCPQINKSRRTLSTYL